MLRGFEIKGYPDVRFVQGNPSFLLGGNGSGKTRTLRALYDVAGQAGLSFRGERLEDAHVTINLEFDNIPVEYGYIRQDGKALREWMFIDGERCIDYWQGKVPQWNLKGAETLLKERLSNNIASCFAYVFRNTSLDTNPINHAFIQSFKFLDGIRFLSLYSVLSDIHQHSEWFAHNAQSHLPELNSLLGKCGFSGKVEIIGKSPIYQLSGKKPIPLFGIYDLGFGGYMDGIHGASLSMVFLCCFFATVKEMEQRKGSLLLVDDWNALFDPKTQSVVLGWLGESPVCMILAGRD